MAVAVRAATDDPHVWVPVFVLCASSAARFFLFRPQLFTFAFFAVFVAVLFRYVIQGRARLWVLPIVMLVWANTHGGFVAGLGAIGLAIALRVSQNLPLDRRSGAGLMEGTKALWATLAACIAVTFINPMGVRLWIYVLTELLHNTNRRYTVEWGPASLRTDAWSAVAITLIAAVFLTVSWFACRQAGRSELPRRLGWAITGVPLVVMSFVSVRHVPLAAIWLAPVIARLASRGGESPAFRRAWFVLRGLSVLPACLTIGVRAFGAAAGHQGRLGRPRQPEPLPGGRVHESQRPCRKRVRPVVVGIVRHLESVSVDSGSPWMAGTSRCFRTAW